MMVWGSRRHMRSALLRRRRVFTAEQPARRATLHCSLAGVLAEALMTYDGAAA